MRVCDYIVSFIYNAGVKDIFMLSGGGSMFLTDALASNEKINKICCHHEQAAAMASIGYAAYSGLGACFVTTGCGGTNTVTGVLHAWQDSVPCFFISGECNRNQTIANSPTKVRQFGPQEANMIPIVSSITKYAVTMTEPEKTAYYLEKALYMATTGRPGPVWLSVPMDVQEAEIGTGENLIHFTPESETGELTPDKLKTETEKTADILRESKRPVILAGHGVQLAKMNQTLIEIAQIAQIPVTVTKLLLDCMPHNDKLYVGVAGTRGNRAANFAIQKADVLLVLGSRLPLGLTGYNYELFAPNANIIVADIDADEHGKQTISIDRFIHSNLSHFLPLLKDMDIGNHAAWTEVCAGWKLKLQRHCVSGSDCSESSDGISMYEFWDVLNKNLSDYDVIVTDAGKAIEVSTQIVSLIGKGQRFISSSGQGEMGFAIPGSVGVCVASGRSVICITGDGSFQLNLQELQTIVHNKLPVKIFVWNNDGYMSIRGHQKAVFNGRYLGVGKESGVSFPSFEKLAFAYGISFIRCNDIEDVKNNVPKIMNSDSPVLCEVMCKFDEPIVASVSTKRLPDGTRVAISIEDMSPFIDRSLYNEIMES